MLQFFKRKLTFFKKSRQDLSTKQELPVKFKNSPTEISKNLSINFELIQEIFDNSADLVVRRFTIGSRSIEAMVVNLSGMSELKLINDNIIGPLMREIKKAASPEQITLKYLKDSAINLNAVYETSSMDEAVTAILNGNAAFFLDSSSKALIMNTKTWAHRGVQQPETEPVVRGSREGFTETLSINISQIRRKIKDPSYLSNRYNWAGELGPKFVSFLSGISPIPKL